MLNKVSIMGRLVRDPELRRTQSGIAVTTMRIAPPGFSSYDTGCPFAAYPFAFFRTNATSSAVPPSTATTTFRSRPKAPRTTMPTHAAHNVILFI